MMMNFIKTTNFLKHSLFILFACVLMACQEDETQSIAISPSTYLTITGSDQVYVGDTREYSLFVNNLDTDYLWNIENDAEGVSITENPANDAYVSVSFTELDTVMLKVSNGELEGTLPIKVVSREMSFEADTVQLTETNRNDTILVALPVTGDLMGNMTVSYTISGSFDASRYEVVPGFESPLSLSKDSVSGIRMVIFPDDELTENDALIIELNEITMDLQDEYILKDTLQSVTYLFEDDLKVASIDVDTVELKTDGVYNIPVTLTNPAGEGNVSVSYTVSADTAIAGFTDVTGGVIVFEIGESSKDISVYVDDTAFALDQSVIVELTGVGSDLEASIDTEFNSKTIQTKRAIN